MSTAGLVATPIGAIVLIILLIIKFKLHASIALIVAAILTAIVAQVPLADTTEVLEQGVGGTLGFLTLVIGFGAILGKLLEVSGGAHRLASTMLRVFGVQRATLVMSLLGFITGYPSIC